jgi:hypothetical protein
MMRSQSLLFESMPVALNENALFTRWSTWPNARRVSATTCNDNPNKFEVSCHIARVSATTCNDNPNKFEVSCHIATEDYVDVMHACTAKVATCVHGQPPHGLSNNLHMRCNHTATSVLAHNRKVRCMRVLPTAEWRESVRTEWALSLGSERSSDHGWEGRRNSSSNIIP